MPGLNPAHQSYLDYLVSERQAEYDRIALYRQYVDGDQSDLLTPEQRYILFGSDTNQTEIMNNICEVIVDVEADRLEVRGFQVNVPDNEELSDTITKLVSQWWRASRMDQGQINANTSAVRDGNSYLIPYHDAATEEPRLAVNLAYDGEVGTEMLYEDDGNPNSQIAAVKVWTMRRPVVGNAKQGRVRRKNVYYPDRIEKYISTISADSRVSNAGWMPYDGDGDPVETLTDDYGNTYRAGVMWWTDNRRQAGKPLGIAAQHLRRGRGKAHGSSVLKNIVPSKQDMLNMAESSLLAATLLSGYKEHWLLGWDADSGEISTVPGAVHAVTNNDGSTIGYSQSQETNLLQLIEVKNSHIKDAAMMTQTPLSFFNISGEIPAEGTMLQLEAGLTAKTKRNQTGLGNGYEDAIRMMLKMEAGRSVQATVDEIDQWEISCEWEPAEVRNQQAQHDMAVVEYTQLDIPREFVWRKRLDYSPEEIEQMLTAYSERQKQAMGALATEIANTEQANQEALDAAAAIVKANSNGTGSNGASDASAN